MDKLGPKEEPADSERGWGEPAHRAPADPLGGSVELGSSNLVVLQAAVVIVVALLDVVILVAMALRGGRRPPAALGLLHYLQHNRRHLKYGIWW